MAFQMNCLKAQRHKFKNIDATEKYHIFGENPKLLITILSTVQLSTEKIVHIDATRGPHTN